MGTVSRMQQRRLGSWKRHERQVVGGRSAAEGRFSKRDGGRGSSQSREGIWRETGQAAGAAEPLHGIVTDHVRRLSQAFPISTRHITLQYSTLALVFDIAAQVLDWTFGWASSILATGGIPSQMLPSRDSRTAICQDENADACSVKRCRQACRCLIRDRRSSQWRRRDETAGRAAAAAPDGALPTPWPLPARPRPRLDGNTHLLRPLNLTPLSSSPPLINHHQASVAQCTGGFFLVASSLNGPQTCRMSPQGRAYPMMHGDQPFCMRQRGTCGIALPTCTGPLLPSSGWSPLCQEHDRSR